MRIRDLMTRAGRGSASGHARPSSGSSSAAHQLLVTEAARAVSGNAALLNYFRIRPVDDDLLGPTGWLEEAWRYYAETELDDAEAVYWSLDGAGCRAFADWLEQSGYARQLLHDDPHAAPAWMLIEPLADRLLPRTTWLAHFTVNAQKLRAEGFRFGVPDVARIALTRRHSVFGDTERIRSRQPGYNFAYPTDGSVQLAQRWGAGPAGYGKQVLLFQSSGMLVHHAGDRDRQVVFWGPSANLATAHVLKAMRNGFVSDDGVKNRSLDGLVAALKTLAKGSHR